MDLGATIFTQPAPMQPGDGGKAKPATKAPVAKLKAVMKPVLQDTLITPKGNIVTKEQFLLSAKNGLPFNDMKTMGDYVDGWARPLRKNAPPVVPAVAPQVKQDYYSGYTTPGSGGMRYHE